MKYLLLKPPIQLLLYISIIGLTSAGNLQSYTKTREWQSPNREITTVIYRKAISFLGHLASFDFDLASKLFHDGFPKKQLQFQLKQTWFQHIRSHGAYRELRQMSISRTEHSFHLLARIIFEKDQLGLSLDFNNKLQISKYSYVPLRKLRKVPQVKVPYDRPNKYTVKHISMGSETYPLKARLYLPNRTPNPSIVILTHDFGPQDLEHRTGINGFFKDIATGLASNGVGCLLYPKRSYVYKMPEGQAIHPSWEVLEDIYNAIFRVKTFTFTRNSNLILLSYGFSSYFVPYLARKKLFDGFILLNPSFRHPIDVLFEIKEFFTAKQSDRQSSQNKIVNLYDRIQKVHQRSLARDEKVFDYPASYFYGLERFKPIPFKKNEIQEPFLSLIAKRDFASNPADYQLSKVVLKEVFHRLETFPRLNRIFHLGDKMNPEQDFLTPGVVSAHVIGEIIKFIGLIDRKIHK